MPVLAAIACVGEKGVIPSPSIPFLELTMSDECCNWAISMSQVSRGGWSPDSPTRCTAANVGSRSSSVARQLVRHGGSTKIVCHSPIREGPPERGENEICNKFLFLSLFR
ncbi:hypothetical protein TNIN_328601 [Trichonephila inaurata madagascariensis]|uniref:Uncharacterized protein n=1 Tax=Trichonephila inaurata madagascariensis TaxID=2747483 RepID=A0A8X6YCM5_9ARAC|nr:hypothetical protein TNIN_328601 [Trichonephila inaurata madagascariensis]